MRNAKGFFLLSVGIVGPSRYSRRYCSTAVIYYSEINTSKQTRSARMWVKCSYNIVGGPVRTISETLTKRFEKGHFLSTVNNNNEQTDTDDPIIYSLYGSTVMTTEISRTCKGVLCTQRKNVYCNILYIVYTQEQASSSVRIIYRVICKLCAHQFFTLESHVLPKKVFRKICTP